MKEVRHNVVVNFFCHLLIPHIDRGVCAGCRRISLYRLGYRSGTGEHGASGADGHGNTATQMRIRVAEIGELAELKTRGTPTGHSRR
jgi:hypothetical protein